MTRTGSGTDLPGWGRASAPPYAVGTPPTVPLSAAAFVAAVPCWCRCPCKAADGSAGPRTGSSRRTGSSYSPPDPWTINACPASPDATNSRRRCRPGSPASGSATSRDAGSSGTKSPLDALILRAVRILVADLESAPAADPSRCAASEPVTSSVMVVTDPRGARDRRPGGGLLRHRSRRAKDRRGGHARSRAPTSGHPTTYDARPLVWRTADCVLLGDSDCSPVRTRHRAGHRRIDLPGSLVPTGSSRCQLDLIRSAWESAVRVDAAGSLARGESADS